MNEKIEVKKSVVLRKVDIIHDNVKVEKASLPSYYGGTNEKHYFLTFTVKSSDLVWGIPISTKYSIEEHQSLLTDCDMFNDKDQFIKKSKLIIVNLLCEGQHRWTTTGIHNVYFGKSNYIKVDLGKAEKNLKKFLGLKEIEKIDKVTTKENTDKFFRFGHIFVDKKGEYFGKGCRYLFVIQSDDLE